MQFQCCTSLSTQNENVESRQRIDGPGAPQVVPGGAQKSALAETLDHGCWPQTPKSAPAAAGGPSGKQTTPRNLFLSKMRNAEGKTVTDACGARVTGSLIDTLGGGTQHASLPEPGATAGETSGEGPTPSTTVQDPGPMHDTYSRPDTRQNTGDSGDTVKQHCMTLVTDCGIFTRLRHSTEDDVIDNISFERQDQRKQEKHADDKDN
jgi:hypothetical protein